MGGLYEQQQIAFRSLSIILIAALVLVFLLFPYESFRVTFAMVLTALFAIAGVYIGLWVTQTEFNITSRMGMTMIVGIVTEITIFYYSEFAETEDAANASERFITAGVNRLRPDCHDHLCCDSGAHAAGPGNRSGLRHAAAFGHRHHCGVVAQLPLVLVVLPAALYLLGVAGRQSLAKQVLAGCLRRSMFHHNKVRSLTLLVIVGLMSGLHRSSAGNTVQYRFNSEISIGGVGGWNILTVARR